MDFYERSDAIGVVNTSDENGRISNIFFKVDRKVFLIKNDRQDQEKIFFDFKEDNFVCCIDTTCILPK